MVGARGKNPCALRRAYVGLYPATPQYVAGRVMEPPVCDPRAARQPPYAMAAAEPLEDPPGVRLTFQGLRVTGGSKLAYGVVSVLPSRMAPAARKRCTR